MDKNSPRFGALALTAMVAYMSGTVYNFEEQEFNKYLFGTDQNRLLLQKTSEFPVSGMVHLDGNTIFLVSDFKSNGWADERFALVRVDELNKLIGLKVNGKKPEWRSPRDIESCVRLRMTENNSEKPRILIFESYQTDKNSCQKSRFNHYYYVEVDVEKREVNFIQRGDFKVEKEINIEGIRIESSDMNKSVTVIAYDREKGDAYSAIIEDIDVSQILDFRVSNLPSLLRPTSPRIVRAGCSNREVSDVASTENSIIFSSTVECTEDQFGPFFSAIHKRDNCKGDVKDIYVVDGFKVEAICVMDNKIVFGTDDEKMGFCLRILPLN